MPPGKAHLWSLVLLLGMWSAPAWAQEPGGVPQDGAEPPSLELLEFLGDWETEDGEWIDPEELEQIALSGQEDKNDDEPQK